MHGRLHPQALPALLALRACTQTRPPDPTSPAAAVAAACLALEQSKQDSIRNKLLSSCSSVVLTASKGEGGSWAAWTLDSPPAPEHPAPTCCRHLLRHAGGP